MIHEKDEEAAIDRYLVTVGLLKNFSVKHTKIMVFDNRKEIIRLIDREECDLQVNRINSNNGITVSRRISNMAFKHNLR